MIKDTVASYFRNILMPRSKGLITILEHTKVQVPPHISGLKTDVDVNKFIAYFGHDWFLQLVISEYNLIVVADYPHSIAVYSENLGEYVSGNMSRISEVSATTKLRFPKIPDHGNHRIRRDFDLCDGTSLHTVEFLVQTIITRVKYLITSRKSWYRTIKHEDDELTNLLEIATANYVRMKLKHQRRKK